MKTERIEKKNNLIESGSVDYGPSRKDLNHNHGGFELNRELEVAEVDEEPKVLPCYRSSVFHLDYKINDLKSGKISQNKYLLDQNYE